MTRRIRFGLFAIVMYAVATAIAIAQSNNGYDDPAPRDEPRWYITKPGIKTSTPGWLKLSNTVAHYQALSGEMELERVGKMPAEAGYETGGATVYKVKNAEAFYHRNQNRMCRGKPVLWLTVVVLPRSIRVGWLTLENWQDYRQDGPGLCRGESRYLPSDPSLLDPY